MGKLFLLFAMMVLMGSCNISNPAEGMKVGRIVKLANEGLIFTTCEGELIRGGFVDGSGSMGTSFRFTVESESLKRICERALEEQIEVRLYYRSYFITWVGRSECGQPHFVTHVEFNE
jgi:hypothetical protein